MSFKNNLISFSDFINFFEKPTNKQSVFITFLKEVILLSFKFFCVLFNIIKSNPRKFLTKDQLTKDKFRAISDFISGMTDRYAINLYNNVK